MGKTAGRGRPREVVDGCHTGIVLPGQQIERLDRMARKLGISRNQLIRNLIEVALEDAEALEALGLFSVAAWLQAMKESLSERRNSVLQGA